jgi:hypothetical protein
MPCTVSQTPMTQLSARVSSIAYGKVLARVLASNSIKIKHAFETMAGPTSATVSVLLIALCLAAAQEAASGGQAAVPKLGLGSLPPHPRLVATDAILARVRGAIKTSPSANRTYGLLLDEGNKILAQQPFTMPPISPSSGILKIARRVSEHAGLPG